MIFAKIGREESLDILIVQAIIVFARADSAANLLSFGKRPSRIAWTSAMESGTDFHTVRADLN